MEKPEKRELIAAFTAAADQSATSWIMSILTTQQARLTMTPEEARDAVRNALVTSLTRFMLEGEGVSSSSLSRVMLEIRPIVESAVAIVKLER